MKTVAIVCEYNPLHLGHIRQFAAIHRAYGEDTRILCLMSGNYVQRGEPAIFDAGTRAAAAVRSGANLVLELPITAAIASAEGFARGAVDVLNRLGMADVLCFGCESGDSESVMSTAKLLCTPEFSQRLRQGLSDGDSFASLRQRTLEAMGGNGSLLRTPNDILAVEYGKALLATGSSIVPMAIRREGSYHAQCPDQCNPSATALRALLPCAQWLAYVPEEARAIFSHAVPHRIEWGERALLARLRAMPDCEFEALPYGSEGLWRKLMKESREADSVEMLIDRVKSRRYARSRIARMVLCAFLGVTAQTLAESVPYVRILGFDHEGRAMLRQMDSQIPLLHAGQSASGSYAELEQRAARMYSLFLPPEETPIAVKQQRVFHQC